MGGWLAASGEITLGAWLLFLLLFLWQHPHFYIIAWICREDYLAGGFKMLGTKAEGQGIFAQILMYSFLLVLASLMLVKLKVLTTTYMIGVLVLGLWFLGESMKVTKSRSLSASKRFLRATVFYLPFLFLWALIDIWTA